MFNYRPLVPQSEADQKRIAKILESENEKVNSKFEVENLDTEPSLKHNTTFDNSSSGGGKETETNNF